MHDAFGANLLDTAVALLRQDLLPQLPEKQKLNALMVANAMRIASRQLRAGDTSQRLELSSMANLFDNVPQAADQNQLQEVLLALNRRLCEDIRRGDADPGMAKHDQIYAHLKAVQKMSVLRTNPRYIGSDG